MSGIKIVVPGVSFDPSLPTLTDDALLAAGSLMLVDPAHSANPWAAGVPATGYAVPNIAWKQAAALLGSGTQASLAGTFTDNHLAADAIFERTGKNGLHAIYSQTNNTNNARGAGIELPAAIKTYMLANPTHQFYYSNWRRQTRVAVAGVVGDFILSSTASATVNFLMFSQYSDATPNNSAATPPNIGKRISPSMNAVGNRLINAAVSAWTGTIASSAANMYGIMAMFGNYGPYQSLANNKAPSTILYRAYLEDLTASGRTYAQADAADYTLWQAAFANGGRYYGDTFTDPATFA